MDIALESGSVLVGGVLIALTLYFISCYTSKDKSTKTVPYTSSGILECVRGFGGNNRPWFLLKLTREAQKLGRSCVRLPLPIPGGFYIVGDAKLQRKIFNDKTTDKVGAVLKPFRALVGSSESLATSPNNDHHRNVRKSTAKAFANKEVARMKEVSIRCTKEWCDMVSERYLDMSDEMAALTFKIICKTSFEYDLSDEENNAFRKDVDIANRELANKQISNPLRGKFGFMIPGVRDALRSCAKVQEFAERILKVYRKNPDKSTHNTIIKLIEENGELSDKQKIAEIIVFLIAGHETTGNAIASCLILLAKHGDKLSKLREDTTGLSPDQWSRSSEYFNYVVKETFRFMPVTAAMTVRSLGKEFETGYGNEIIPKGAQVMLPLILPCRDKKIFGDDADSFNPDRWYDATPEMKDAVMQFASGTRNCIGQSLANSQLETILPYILSRFDVELIEEGTTDTLLNLKYSNSKLLLKKRNADVDIRK